MARTVIAGALVATICASIVPSVRADDPVASFPADRDDPSGSPAPIGPEVSSGGPTQAPPPAMTRTVGDAPRAWQRHRMTIDDVSLSIAEAGAGPPLLLLAGEGMAADRWDPAVIRALGSRRHVIAFDYRGTGSSGGPRIGATPVSVLAADAAAIVRGLGLERVDILGWSLGASVAMQLALDEPDLVARLVLVAPDVGVRGSLSGTEVAEALSYGDREAERLMFGEDTAALASWKARRDRRSDCCRWVPADVVEGQIETRMAWAASDEADRVTAIRAPTLILHGTADELVPARNAIELAQRLRYASVRLVPGLAHGVPLADPMGFDGYVEAFLSQQSDAPVTTMGTPRADDDGLARRIAEWRSGALDASDGLEGPDDTVAASGIASCHGEPEGRCPGDGPPSTRRAPVRTYHGILLGAFRTQGSAILAVGFTGRSQDRFVAWFRLGAALDGPVEIQRTDTLATPESGRFLVTAQQGLRRLQGAIGHPIALYVPADGIGAVSDPGAGPVSAGLSATRELADAAKPAERRLHRYIWSRTTGADLDVQEPGQIGWDPGDVDPDALPAVMFVATTR